jgi:hypothetical protein
VAAVVVQWEAVVAVDRLSRDQPTSRPIKRSRSALPVLAGRGQALARKGRDLRSEQSLLLRQEVPAVAVRRRRSTGPGPVLVMVATVAVVVCVKAPAADSVALVHSSTAATPVRRERTVAAVAAAVRVRLAAMLGAVQRAVTAVLAWNGLLRQELDMRVVAAEVPARTT